MLRLQQSTVNKFLVKAKALLAACSCDMPDMNAQLPPEMLAANLDRVIAELHLLRVLVRVDETIGRQLNKV